MVACDFARQGFELLEHRWKTPFAEIDLLFRALNGGRLVVVEVKTWNKGVYGDFSAFDILPRKQAIRLIKAREFVEASRSSLVELQIAVVSYDDGCWAHARAPEIHLFDPPIPHRAY